MTVDDGTLARRADRVVAMLAALSAGDVSDALSFFADDAHVMRVRYFVGRVDGAETLAIGRRGMHEWFDALVQRRLHIEAVSIAAEGDALAVRGEWALDGFHGERVHSASRAVYDFDGDQITRLRVTSSEEEGEA